MLQIPVQDLRRVAASLHRLQGKSITDLVMRADLRQLKIELSGGEMLVVGLESDDLGRPHLAVDVVSPSEESSRQLEVGLEHGAG